MPVGIAVGDRLAALTEPSHRGLDVRLPASLKRDPLSARLGLMQRLATSRQFAFGDRSGVLRAAGRRSGHPFRLDVRQRVIVKALVSRHAGHGLARAAALRAHIAYLGRDGAGAEGHSAVFFDGSDEGIDATSIVPAWTADRHHFRFIVSPEHGDRIEDLRGYVREVMARVAADLGELDLVWLATTHYDTDQPHAHVLVRGRRSDGRDLVIPRDYIGYGFRARAQEAAQAQLGDLSRIDAERRVWKETQADRFTGFDRRLLAAADSDGTVQDGVGTTAAWAALTRGRLRHLEALGLVIRERQRYCLAGDLEARLRGLQLRRDVQRTINQRRLEAGSRVQLLASTEVRGRVVKSGMHDEAGSLPFVIVRDAAGLEHYARVPIGAILPRTQTLVSLIPTGPGAATIRHGRGADLHR